MPGPLISFHLASMHPDKLGALFQNLESTADEPDRIEVIVKVDEENEAMNAFIRAEQKRRKIHIRFISTPRGEGYFGLWSAYNEILEVCDPNAYFVSLINDEVSFPDPGWDSVLERYVGFYSDDLFRLRISEYRQRNYRDIWECGYAPDAYAIYTKRWFDISGDWCPCNTPDAFQQCVAYYLWKATRPGPRNVQHNRDVPVLDIRLEGEAPYQGLSDDQLKSRVRQAKAHWFRLMSWSFQTEASKRAHVLLAYLTASEENQPQYSIDVDENRKLVNLVDRPSGRILNTWSYALPRWAVVAKNLWRKPLFEYWCGGDWSVIGIHLRQRYNDQIGYFERWKSRWRRLSWELTRRRRPGREAGASSAIERHPTEYLIDGRFDPWGSQETNDDTYFWITHRKKISARRIRLCLFSPGGHAHLRQLSVVARNISADGSTSNWMMIRARIREADEVMAPDYRVSVPAKPDFSNITVEIDENSPAYGAFDTWGLCCLSTSRDDKRNWLDEGRGIYVRRMVVE